MTGIDDKLLWRFVKRVGERLSGDWVLIGGTVLPLLGVKKRITLDIDICGSLSSTQSDSLRLMEIALELGLPVEAINQAGSHFLHRIKDYSKHLVELHRGKKARIYRPDATLFLLLKIGRMSETDVSDCLDFLKITKKSDHLDLKRVMGALQKAIKEERAVARKTRLHQLLESIGRFT